MNYVTLAPVTPKGKWRVLVKRVGKPDSMGSIAECPNETYAQRIVDALNAQMIRPSVFKEAAE